MKILLVGQSGSGKSTIVNALYKQGFSKIIECTTRPVRDNERDGFDYEFISRKIYDDMVLNDELILCSKFDTKFGEWCYGVKRSHFNNIKNFVLVTNYMALNNTNHEYLQDCYIIMLKASEEELYRRANDRGDDLEEFSRRLNKDKEYINQIDKMCDLVIDTSKHSVDETVNIILTQDEKPKMSGGEYQNLAMRTNDGKATNRLLNLTLSDTTAIGIEEDTGAVLNACLGLSGEVGEFNDIIKKWIFHERDLDEEHLKKELGDIMWYIAMMCHAFKWNLDEIMRMNIDKLKARYPEGFDVNRANNRGHNDV